jgi:hypothetical protein
MRGSAALAGVCVVAREKLTPITYRQSWLALTAAKTADQGTT